MHSEYVKAMVCGVWILAICIGGLAAGIASVPLWIVLASVAIAPPILAAKFWQVPAPTLSETIQQARR